MATKIKASTGILDCGTPAHCLRTLIETLGTVISNRCRVGQADDDMLAAEFEIITQADEKQQRALDLLKRIRELSLPTARL